VANKKDFSVNYAPFKCIFCNDRELKKEQTEVTMKTFFRNLTLYFSAGCLGGLANSLTVWVFGAIGITAALGVKIAPSISAPWLYPRIVWGGIWGAIFLLPIFRNSYFLRGLILSLGPTIVQLFVVFPIKANKGVMGLELGNMTPVFVLFFNAVWGLCAAYWLKFIDEEK
jgi:hypothetical protein